MSVERRLPQLPEDISAQVERIVVGNFASFDPFDKNQPPLVAAISHNGITYPCKIQPVPKEEYHELTIGDATTVLMDFHTTGDYKKCPAAAFSQEKPNFWWVEFSAISTTPKYRGKGFGSIAVRFADALVADLARRNEKEIFAFVDDFSIKRWTTAAFTKNGYASTPISNGCFVLGLIRYGPRLYKWYKPSQVS